MFQNLCHVILRGGFSVGRRVSETDPARKVEENVEFSDNPNFMPEESLSLRSFADGARIKRMRYRFHPLLAPAQDDARNSGDGLRFAFTLAEGATHVAMLPTKAKFAFTLAEVLITLGVIGVVAAMTIPTLMTKYQQIQTVNRLKKTYAVLQQAVRMASDDYGDCEAWDYTLPKDEFVKQYFSPYIKVSPVNMTTTYKDLRNKTYTYGDAFPKFMLPDGGIVIFNQVEGFQVKNHFIVDINGVAGPNRMGRDVFCFSFYRNILTTYTQYENNNWKHNVLIQPNTTSGQCTKTATGGIGGPGSYCSRLIEVDGWKITKDYPWN